VDPRGGTHQRDLADNGLFVLVRELKQDSSWAFMVWGNSQKVGQAILLAADAQRSPSTLPFQVSPEKDNTTIQAQ
jgi:hypothetical protein